MSTDPQALRKGLPLYQQARDLRAAGRLDEAARCFAQALQLLPEHPGLLTDCAALAETRADWPLAAQLHRRRLQLAPAAVTRLQLANALYRAGQLPAARDIAQQAVEFAPDDPTALTILGSCLKTLGRRDEALALAERALQARPTAAATALRLACLLETGRTTELDVAAEAACTQFPQDPQIRHIAADHWLRAGDYARGFRDIDWLRPPGSSRAQHPLCRLPCADWDGQPFAGTLLVGSEQGLGDEILASSVFPDLVAMQQHAVIECEPRLVALFARSFPALSFVARGENRLTVLAGGNCRKALPVDLLRLRRSNPAVWPSAWLQADPVRTAGLRRKYRSQYGDRLLVGLSWNSRRAYQGGSKSLALGALEPLLSCEHFACISLQYGDIAADLAAAGSAGERLIRDPEIDPSGDIDGLAAQIAALDVVVSASNTTVHIAGALGKPCHVLLPRHWPVLWYWGYRGATTPWYPSLRLHRNPDDNHWQPLLADLVRELQTPPHIG